MSILRLPHHAPILLLLLAAATAVAAPPAALTTIAFGSCNRQNRGQDFWPTITATQPDLWIWLGDIVYADTEDMTVMRAKYDGLKADPGYTVLRRACAVTGMWDDHDYGANDVGKWYPQREASQRELLRFLDEPADSPRHTRAGVYGSARYGPPEREVCVILLDNRYHADRAGPEAELLGAAQWTFLEQELATNRAAVTLICSGIQVLPVDHKYDAWHRYGQERARLLQAIADSRQGGVLLLSGDRHLHELSLLNDAPLHYPLLEATSSGLNQSYARLKAERNRFRVGPQVKVPGFGLIEIDWEARPVQVAVSLRDMSGGTRNRLELPLTALQPHKDLP